MCLRGPLCVFMSSRGALSVTSPVSLIMLKTSGLCLICLPIAAGLYMIYTLMKTRAMIIRQHLLNLVKHPADNVKTYILITGYFGIGLDGGLTGVFKSIGLSRLN